MESRPSATCSPLLWISVLGAIKKGMWLRFTVDLVLVPLVLIRWLGGGKPNSICRSILETFEVDQFPPAVKSSPFCRIWALWLLGRWRSVHMAHRLVSLMSSSSSERSYACHNDDGFDAFLMDKVDIMFDLRDSYVLHT